MSKVVRPTKPCPYCGGTSLTVKRWGSRGTYFVACSCTATGPSMARSREEAVAQFDHRANPVQTTIFDVAPSVSVEVEDWDGIRWLPDHDPKTYLCHGCATSFGLWTSNEDGDTFDVEPVACPRCGGRVTEVMGHE